MSDYKKCEHNPVRSHCRLCCQSKCRRMMDKKVKELREKLHNRIKKERELRLNHSKEEGFHNEYCTIEHVNHIEGLEVSLKEIDSVFGKKKGDE